ncbi:prosaposin-like [Tripterygium wilfordii]|nr:prosaposin-like [Tripterygium wilfordii]XP_038701439.1 prosaposin-like [Tripterygium wilfordii]XP_038701440.1 prosaposin-like [Tripterygium wilfordii]XP_038701441.1 prosaposin-like [Tripterygium wilfordii]
MGMRVGLLFLLVLGVTWICDARTVVTLKPNKVIYDISGNQKHENGIGALEVSRNDRVCTLCEEFTTEAIDYLSENKTQTEVLDILHKACSRVSSYEEQCLILVDYYASLFFQQISSTQPGDFCVEVNLCKQIAVISSKLHEDTCGICQRAVSEMLIKLKDPDAQLEIIEQLLEACNSMNSFAKKCKKMVFEYGPIILANAEQFLETTDVCTILHACKSYTETGEQSLQTVTVPSLANS